MSSLEMRKMPYSGTIRRLDVPPPTIFAISSVPIMSSPTVDDHSMSKSSEFPPTLFAVGFSSTLRSPSDSKSTFASLCIIKYLSHVGSAACKNDGIFEISASRYVSDEYLKPHLRDIVASRTKFSFCGSPSSATGRHFSPKALRVLPSANSHATENASPLRRDENVSASLGNSSPALSEASGFASASGSAEPAFSADSAARAFAADSS